MPYITKFILMTLHSGQTCSLTSVFLFYMLFEDELLRGKTPVFDEIRLFCHLFSPFFLNLTRIEHSCMSIVSELVRRLAALLLGAVLA